MSDKLKLALTDAVHFLLTPDRSSARALRREIVQRGARLGVQVGTWPELMELLRGSYLLTDIRSDWNERLAEAAQAMPSAFWAASLEVAHQETLESVGRVLFALIEGAGPDGAPEPPAPGILSQRASRHLSDLALLHGNMGRVLPPELAAMVQLLSCDPAEAIRRVVVYHCEGLPRLSPWQSALLRRLEAEEGNCRDRELASIIAGTFNSGKTGERKNSLACIQEQLFEANQKPVVPDDTVQWLAARDYLEEIEVAVGMLQQALAGNPALSAADFGLLIPNDDRYARGVRDTFSLAGLPVSGLTADLPVRDLGRETVLYYLLCCRKPAPAMAIAALLASPLMPWCPEDGSSLAQTIMDGEFDLKAPEHMAFEGTQMLRLIKTEREDPKQLALDLEKFASLLCAPSELELHLARARALLGELVSSLQGLHEIPWQELIGRAAPERVTVPSGSILSREGISVFTEHEEPWRRVRHLLVLGFEAGRYPAEPPRNAIFSDTDLSILNEKLGYDMETGADVNARRRSLFRRQLGCADDRVTFLLPRRDSSGKRLLPSQTLTFIAILFKGIHEPEELILELDTSFGRKHARGLALAPPLGPIPPRPLKVADLAMECDLLRLRCYDDGTPKPQSPSSLETLMVSPFAWLLRQAGFAPLEWVPESLDVASKGTLAHDVFEHLFQPGVPLPSAREIMESVPGLLNQAIIRKRPFLLRSEWHVERRHLQHDIEVAATRWSEMLGEIGARVLGNEVWLKGRLDDLPIHGSADLLIALPKGRLYVVDYKKSGSKARLERMKKGYDSQASLYRLMLETGGEDNRKNEALAVALDAKTEIGVLYYLLNDQVALADSSGWITNSVVGIEELGSGISTNALIRIRSRIDEVRSGKVALNSETDEDWYDKNAGIKMYALDNSPLLRLFMHPAPEESE